jgi:hypothetical protein
MSYWRLLHHTAGLTPNLFRADIQLLQYIERNTINLTQQPKQKMLRADVMVAQAAGFIHPIFKYFFRPRCKIQPRILGALTGTTHSFDKFFYTARIELKVAQCTPRNPAVLAHQAEQQMFSTNIAVMK